MVMSLLLTGDQIGGIARAVLGAIGGMAVTRGMVDQSTMVTVVGGLVTVIVALWSYWTNRPDGLIQAVNRGDNGVKVVAERAPGDRVTAALR